MGFGVGWFGGGNVVERYVICILIKIIIKVCNYINGNYLFVIRKCIININFIN